MLNVVNEIIVLNASAYSEGLGICTDSTEPVFARIRSPFELRFARGPMAARFYMFTRYLTVYVNMHGIYIEVKDPIRSTSRALSAPEKEHLYIYVIYTYMWARANFEVQILNFNTFL